MLNQRGSRQEQIMNLLLTTKSGLSIDTLAEQIEISRNAVKKHLDTLEKISLVQAANLNITGGRPSRNYKLTDQGINYFTKQYAWFGSLVLTEIKQEMGGPAFSRFMQRLGAKIASSLAPQFTDKSPAEKVQILTTIMQNLGYQASVENNDKTLTITAINCVFHDLAQEHTELCEFDRALIGNLLDNPVEQTECMAEQGSACCFKTKV
ncbi:MAG TPA: HTH domain-containing protein [Methyloprofundus sp.]|uniref:helix-turn-helix transcriptional regulator n=1 Tax=Methyloprofundus sp. TaxID=2020875 RepID=UPI0018224B72|nr:HTH domain-containing protein [Methyloprofundus sp.]HIG64382.1 HTH domain-containing protein [Methyloprofundus sp.]HIL79049.1 HTH domain-containing protein [Methylococcales bacterium]